MPTGLGEYESVELHIGDQSIATFKSYAVNSHFLTPTDAFSVTIGDEVVTPELVQLCKPGTRVQLKVNGLVQMTGYLDSRRITSSRAGTELILEGRDAFAPVLDSTADPRTTLSERVTMELMFKKLLGPYGFTKFYGDSNENIQTATGLKRQRKSKKPPYVDIAKQRPHDNEGIFPFLSRIVQRRGMWIWPGVDGESVIVGKPNYDQEPAYKIVHRLGGSQNNVLESDVLWDATDQPSEIIAVGNFGRVKKTRDKFAVVVHNSFVMESTQKALQGIGYVDPNDDKLDSEEDERQKAINDTGSKNALSGIGDGMLGYGATGTEASFVRSGTVINGVKYEGVVREIFVPAPPFSVKNAFASTVAKSIRVRDFESKTEEELERFARRELSLRTRRALVARYVLRGHTYGDAPFTTDTVVSVDDDRSDLHMNMWVLSRTFRKLRQAGTTTELELIPLHALEF